MANSTTLNIINLDVIISVGYRVKSIRGTQFRIWANSVLKDYLLKGYAVSKRFERIEDKLYEHDKPIAELVQTALPPKQGIYFDGQIFDVYLFVNELIKSAKKSTKFITWNNNEWSNIVFLPQVFVYQNLETNGRVFRWFNCRLQTIRRTNYWFL